VKSCATVKIWRRRKNLGQVTTAHREERKQLKGASGEGEEDQYEVTQRTFRERAETIFK
jgi:hypothetical protein